MINSSDRDGYLTLLVRQITAQAVNINSYELVDIKGEKLPAISPGAHIDVEVPGGYTRQYSLCNDPSERYRYVIAVLRDESGRGGSRALHEEIKVNNLLTVSMPRNNFELSGNAKKHILIAGGIGITPLKSMAHYLKENDEKFEMHYCAKGHMHAAFLDELKPLIHTGQLTMHYDNGNHVDGLNISQLLREYEDGTHVYYCGPGGFMAACEAASLHWPKDTVHFEHFKAPVSKSTSINTAVSGCFTIKVASTGDIFEVPVSKTITEVLSENGYAIETSCEAGLCATCKIGYLSGEADHQDFILDDEERTKFMTPCVSRAKSELIELDI